MSNNGQPVILNDRYELQQRIGRGGMADVFLARDQLLNRQVAIKVLFPEFATDPNFVERFRREAQSAANLNHPNIVSVYDWGKYSNTYFMAMEYVQGRTLADVLRANGHINSIQAAEIASEVAAALGHAHRNGVAHRDIKPANILIGSSGQVKVADFGIARAMNAATESNLTQVGNVMGTATYFSPEPAQGAQPDPRSDRYSLGIVLYEMVAGKPPFTGENPVSIAYKQVHDLPQPLNQVVVDVPRGYEAIVAKLLAKKPEVRYQTAEALRDDLRRFRNGEPVQALAAAAGPGNGANGNGAAGAATAGVVAAAAGATVGLPRTTAMPQSGQYPPGYNQGTAPMARTVGMPQQQYAAPVNDERKGGWYAVAGFIALLALVAGGFVLYTALSKKDNTSAATSFAMPSLVGRPLEDAIKILSDANLSYSEPEQDLAATVEEGQVSLTEPAADALVTAGDVVRIVYRPISVPIPIPDVTRMTTEKAIETLTGLGFTVNPTPDVEKNPEFEVGTVIRTDPPALTPAKQGTEVKLVVSGGPDQIAVPNVISQTQDNATALLSGEPFLLVVSVETQPSDTVAAGSVIGTTPAAGELVTKGSPITMIVSEGPPKKVVPALEGLTEAAAKNLLNANSLGVQVETVPVAAGSPQDGRVISQSVPSGTQVAAGTVVKIKVGVGLVPPTTSTSTTTTLPPTTTTAPTTTAPTTTT